MRTVPMHFDTPTRNLFCVFPEQPPRWKHFAFSMGAQSTIIIALLGIAAFPPKLLLPAHSSTHLIKLAEAPAALNLKPSLQPDLAKPETPSLMPRYNPIVVRTKNPLSIKSVLVKPVPINKEETPLAPKIQLATRVVPLPPSAPLIPKQLVKTNVFSAGKTESQAPPTEAVHTGSFGDPNGLAAKATHGNAVTIAHLGAFELPPGAGGSDQAGRGVVSAGFSAGTASLGHQAHGSTGAPAQAGFGDAQVVAAAQNPRQTEVSKTLPAEILSKPTPIYTEEAKKLHIEGEVLLEVLFESSGNVQVVRVVRGLGHGLDEAAIQAAQQIHFKPALRDGQPANSRGVLHITFQMA